MNFFLHEKSVGSFKRILQVYTQTQKAITMIKSLQALLLLLFNNYCNIHSILLFTYFHYSSSTLIECFQPKVQQKNIRSISETIIILKSGQGKTIIGSNPINNYCYYTTTTNNNHYYTTNNNRLSCSNSYNSVLMMTSSLSSITTTAFEKPSETKPIRMPITVNEWQRYRAHTTNNLDIVYNINNNQPVVVETYLKNSIESKNTTNRTNSNTNSDIKISTTTTTTNTTNLFFSIKDYRLYFTDVVALLLSYELIGLLDVINNPIFINNGGWIQSISSTINNDGSSTVLTTFIPNFCSSTILYTIIGIYIVPSSFTYKSIETIQSTIQTVVSTLSIFFILKISIHLLLLFLLSSTSTSLILDDNSSIIGSIFHNIVGTTATTTTTADEIIFSTLREIYILGLVIGTFRYLIKRFVLY